MYHHSKRKKMNFRGLGDSIASKSSIWQQLNEFGSEVKKLFEEQFYPMNCIPIGLNEHMGIQHKFTKYIYIYIYIYIYKH
jgi:hypothetical protein